MSSIGNSTALLWIMVSTQSPPEISAVAKHQDLILVAFLVLAAFLILVPLLSADVVLQSGARPSRTSRVCVNWSTAGPWPHASSGPRTMVLGNYDFQNVHVPDPRFALGGVLEDFAPIFVI
jgi:hypothetical protein